MIISLAVKRIVNFELVWICVASCDPAGLPGSRSRIVRLPDPLDLGTETRNLVHLRSRALVGDDGHVHAARAHGQLRLLHPAAWAVEGEHLQGHRQEYLGERVWLVSELICCCCRSTWCTTQASALPIRSSSVEMNG